MPEQVVRDVIDEYAHLGRDVTARRSHCGNVPGRRAHAVQTASTHAAGSAADVTQPMIVTAWNGAIAGGGLVGGYGLDTRGPAAWFLVPPRYVNPARSCESVLLIRSDDQGVTGSPAKTIASDAPSARLGARHPRVVQALPEISLS
ncbi:hypothetical protein QP164_04445 [Sphingomonas sp. LR59]|uniref:hypothetical protein n=1 Tax=Sphingomonas sp. LR59 TaxID=3050232 RepID=UPI002FE42321